MLFLIEDEHSETRIDPEELKRQEIEEAKRKVKPDHFKAMMLSRAGEGTDDAEYQVRKGRL